MNRKTIWIVLALLLLPLLARFAWYFPGLNPPRRIATPDYAGLKMPEAPVATPQVEKIKHRGGVVILDYAHSNQFQPSEVQSLFDALEGRSARVELNNETSRLESQLKSASAYVILSPSNSFSAEETNLLRDFVRRGGRLAVFTDATRGLTYYDFFGNPSNSPDVNVVNPLLASFGITVQNDYLYNLAENEGNFRNVFFDSFGKSELTWGLKKVALYGTHSVRADSGLPLLIGADQTYSSQTDAGGGWSPAILDETGNVAVFGDFSFLMVPYTTVADNGTLINNIADFLLNGKRELALSNYPYLFSGSSVSVLPASNVQMTAEMVSALSRLQAEMKSLNTDMRIVQSKPDEGDLIVLGTYSPSDDLVQYLEKHNLTLEDFSEFVEVPGFGKIGRAGNGILLFDTGKRGNTIVLLADTPVDLTALMDTLSYGSLSGCVLQKDIGVCSIGFGGSFNDGSTSPDGSSGEPAPTPAGPG